MPGIEWARVEMFHLDEYIGLPVSHPASFRKYLLERLIRKTGITKYHFLDGDGNVPEIVRKVSAELTAAPIDIAFVGIGENGHLAFCGKGFSESSYADLQLYTHGWAGEGKKMCEECLEKC